MKLGILFPTPREMGDFAEGLTDGVEERRGRLIFTCGTRGALEIVTAVCGVCKTNAAVAAAEMIERFGAEKIIVCGVAGALDRDLHPGNTIVLTECGHHDIDASVLDMDDPGQAVCAQRYAADPELLRASMEALRDDPGGNQVEWGMGVSGECFVRERERREIVKKFSALCADMETAAVAQTCLLLGVGWLAIRSVSDVAGSGYEDFVRPATETSRAALGRLLDRLGG